MTNMGQANKATQQHISNDFVPSSMVRGANNLKESEDQLARLIGITNDTFAEMGVSTSYGKKPAAANKKSDTCNGCQREIIGRVISALDATWHPACFQCTACCKPIELGGANSSFIVRGGNKAWCTKCDDWDKKESKSKKAAANAASSAAASSAVSAKNAEILKKNAAQAEAHDNIQQGKELCAACNKAILGEAVDYTRGTVQQFFHVACFQCAHCRKPVDNTAEGFQHYKNKIYHPACYKSLIGHGPCGGCGQNITTKYVVPEAGGPKYHSACFVCSVASCKKELASGFCIRDGAAYCAACADARFSSTTNITGSKMTGFKVDPMTHKKIATTTYTGAPINQQPAKVTTTTTVGTGANATTTVKKNFCTGCGTPSQGGKFCAGCGKAL